MASLPYSDAFYIQAFPRECTEAFQEGHRRAFEFFGRAPTRVSYDNSKIAVTKITGSRERELTREFLRLQSHYLFESHFCLVRRANEKGHVENLVGFGRRNYLVPIPKVDSFEQLNAELERRCQADLDRTLRGKSGYETAALARRTRGHAGTAQPGVRCPEGNQCGGQLCKWQSKIRAPGGRKV